MKIRFAIYLTFLVSLSACTTQCERKNDAKKDYSDIDISANSSEPIVFYRFPAPSDIITYIKNERLVFHKEFLNPVDNTNKYVDTRLQHFNLGVFSADFAYITVFKTLGEASLYFKSIEKLAYQTGLSSVFDENLRNRVQANESNIDSLGNIARESYNRMISSLTANGNERQLSIIFAGGYVEVLYIALNQIDDFEKDFPLLRKIYDQRYGLENLTQFISDYSDDPWIDALNKDLFTILDAFNMVEEKILKRSTPIKGQSGEFKLSGGKVDVLISLSQYQLLKDRVISIRQKYTNPLTGLK